MLARRGRAPPDGGQVSRSIEADDIVGPAEIAERLGLQNANTLNLWRRRHADFPSPVKILRSGSLWSWQEVEVWARRTGRL